MQPEMLNAQNVAQSTLNAAILKISMGQTNTHTHTHKKNDYRNPCCACVPRVNKQHVNDYVSDYIISQ